MLWYEFTRWWAYRRIRDAKMHNYVWTVPLFVTLSSFGIYYAVPVKPVVVGAGGLIEKMSLAFTILPGFFISALAAVATFNRPEMDETMPEPAPTAMVHHRGNLVEIELTRRMFLSYLFSYLSVMSLFLFVFTNSLEFIQGNILHFLGLGSAGIWQDTVRFIYENIGVGIVIYFASTVLVTMLHGIYFLCERIHMPNS